MAPSHAMILPVGAQPLRHRCATRVGLLGTRQEDEEGGETRSAPCYHSHFWAGVNPKIEGTASTASAPHPGAQPHLRYLSVEPGVVLRQR